MSLARLGNENLRRLLLDKLWPAYFFSLILFAKADGVRGQALQRWEAEANTLGFWLWLSHQALTLVFLGVVVALFIIRRPRVGERSDLVGALVALGGTFGLGLAALLPSGNTPTWVLGLSAVLLAGGLILAGVSLLWLGRCFGLFPEARGLVTSGPYSLVRHPVYLGEIISATGAVLPSLSIWGLLLLLATGLLQYWRALNEERALGRALPEYEAYQARTWRLLPWVH